MLPHCYCQSLKYISSIIIMRWFQWWACDTIENLCKFFSLSNQLTTVNTWLCPLKLYIYPINIPSRDGLSEKRSERQREELQNIISIWDRVMNTYKYLVLCEVHYVVGLYIYFGYFYWFCLFLFVWNEGGSARFKS